MTTTKDNTPASNDPTSHDQSDFDQKSVDLRQHGERLLAKKLGASKLAMFLEDLWLKLWGPFLVAALFIIASLYELWDHLSPLAHRFTLALFCFAALASLYPFYKLRWPSEKKALKRLDENTTLPHQPAQAFKDNLDPNLANPQTRTLWMQFKQRLVDKIQQLKVRAPSPNTAAKDPYALRMVLLLAIAAGLFIQAGNWRPLLSKGLTLQPMLDTSSLRIDAWVTPPPYTQQPPILISDGGKNKKQPSPKPKFEAPENAILTIRINGKNADRLSLANNNNPLIKNDSKNSIKTSKQKSAKKTTQEFHIKLKQSGPVKLLLDEIPFASWEFDIAQDNHPIIGLIDAPTRAQTGALKLKYKVADDYGVIAANAHFENVSIDGKTPVIDKPEDQKPLGTPPIYPLNLPEQNTKEGEGETFRDLTRHPWAGLVATLYLSATDEGENTSQSPKLTLQIPAYKFTKPLAKDIIRLRKQLIITPYESPLTAKDLYGLTVNKEPFEKDLSLYLGLRTASTRLLNAQTRKEKEDIAELLYELARHIEDGDLSQAERALRAAQDALRKALQENASTKEIQKKINELRKALKNYMQALGKQQQNQNAQNNNGGKKKQKDNQKLNQKDLEQMLKTIEELAKLGSKDLANQMLSQLQNMLENMKTDKGNNDQNQQAETAKQLEELSKLLSKQQKLVDQTFNQRRQQNQTGRRADQENPPEGQAQSGQSQQQRRQSGTAQQGQNGKQHSQSLEEQQLSLQEQLDNLMRQMKRGQGKRNQALESSKRAMGRARQMLKNNDLNNALSEERQALDQLQKGMEQLGRQNGQKSAKGGGKKENGNDPAGRPSGQTGMDTSNTTKIPGKIDIQRAREILQNLQEKMSDPNRAATELDYFERLLKRF